MRILWLTIDRSMRALQFYDDFRAAVCARAEVNEIIKKVENPVGRYCSRIQKGEVDLGPSVVDVQKPGCDLIFCDAYFAYINEDWSRCRTPRIVMMGDMHGKLPAWYIGHAVKWHWRVMSLYQESLAEWWPGLATMWMPCCCSTETFRPYGDRKIPKVLGSGVLDPDVYPLRTQAHKRLADQDFYTRIERPPETQIGEYGPRGIEYARIIAKHKLAINCSSRFKYAVTKMFEIPACGTAMIADQCSELDRLGFQPWLHYVPLDPSSGSFVGDIRRWCAEPNEAIDNIAEQGMELIQSRHTYEHRGDLFMEHAEQTVKTWSQ